LAEQINADPYVTVTFRTGAGTQPSERVLPVAIGEAATGAGSTADHEAEAETMRAERGSWAVIAARLDAGLVTVQSRLAGILDAASGRTTTSAAAVADVTRALRVVASAVPTAPAGLLPIISSSGPKSVTPTTSPTSPTVRSTAVPSQAAATPSQPVVAISAVPTTPTAPTTPSATPTPNPGLVGGLLKAVVGLVLPTASPSPSASAATKAGTEVEGVGTSLPTAPTPESAPTTANRSPVKGLLGGLLGGH
jgi:hypothetical protein